MSTTDKNKNTQQDQNARQEKNMSQKDQKSQTSNNPQGKDRDNKFSTQGSQNQDQGGKNRQGNEDTNKRDRD